VLWNNSSLNLASDNVSGYSRRSGVSAISHELPTNLTGAIGFDWVIVDQGGVSWLISWPRKKLITQ